jgi:hypothetical protein
MAIEKGRPFSRSHRQQPQSSEPRSKDQTKLGAKAPAGWSPYITSEARRIFALYKTEGPRFHCSAELSRGKKLKEPELMAPPGTQNWSEGQLSTF